MDPADNTKTQFAAVTATNQLYSAGYHYNTSSLSWEANTGGTASGGDVNVTNFPANPSTSTLQTTGNASLATIAGATDVALSTRLKAADTLAGVTTVGAVTNITNTVAISAASLPLPTGAATDAAFVAANGSATDHPAAYTVMDRLYQLGIKLDTLNATEKQVLAALIKPVGASVRPTLLHGR